MAPFSLYDILRSGPVRRAELASERAQSQAGKAQRSADGLEDQVGRLTLVATAMWELLRDRLQVSEEELLKKLQDVDLRDGKKDGKHNPPAVACPGCQRANHRRHVHCLYCGADLPIAPA
jgi:hypothetical protein